MSLFLLFSLISMLGWVANNLAFAPFSRKYSGNTVSIYRSLGVALCIPVLLFGVQDWSSFQIFIDLWWLTTLWGILGAYGIYAWFNALKYLETGLASGLNRLSSILPLVFSSVFLGYSISQNEYLGGGIVFVCGILMSLAGKKTGMSTGDDYLKGLFWIAGRILGTGGWLIILGFFAGTDPYASAIVSEYVVLLALIPTFFSGETAQKGSVKKSDILWMLLFGIFTVVGTGGLALAASYGNIGLAVLIGTLATPLTGIGGALLFKEQLKVSQWLWMAGIVAGIVIMSL